MFSFNIRLSFGSYNQKVVRGSKTYTMFQNKSMKGFEKMAFLTHIQKEKCCTEIYSKLRNFTQIIIHNST